ncbi:MAG: aminomethyltransferase beta-barrel domain-containing protein, partial [Bacteroidota bacterium]
KVFFGKGVHAIAPGQAAVFYEGDDVIGGGWIQSSFRQTNRLSYAKTAGYPTALAAKA